MLAADRCTGLLDLHDGLRVLAGTSRFGTGTNILCTSGQELLAQQMAAIGQAKAIRCGSDAPT